MVTSAAAMDAEARARDSRFAMRGLLHVEESRVKPADVPLVERIRAASTPKAYDDVLALPVIADLFRRQVLYFGDVP